MSQQFHDSAFDADEETGAQQASKKGAGAASNLIALGRNPTTSKIVVLTGLAVLAVGFLIAATIVRREQQVQAASPSSASVNVGRAPGDPPVSRVALAPGQAERTRELEAKALEAAAAEARSRGESVQPPAEKVESRLRPSLTPEEAAYEEQRKAASAEAQRRIEAAMSAASAASQGYPADIPPMPGQMYPRQPDPTQEVRMARAAEVVEKLINRTPTGSQTFHISPVGVASAEQAPATRSGSAPAASAAGADNSILLIQAGTIEAMRVDTAVNTDHGEKFRATLLTGPYKGALINGTYRRSGEVADLAVSSIALRNPKVTLPAQGVGLDPETWEIGTATDVDRKLLVRYGIKPLAAGFATVAEYLKSAGTTVIVNNGSTTTSTPPLTGKRTGQIVLGSAAGQVANDSESLNTTPTAKVARNSVVGVYFTADVRFIPEQR